VPTPREKRSDASIGDLVFLASDHAAGASHAIDGARGGREHVRNRRGEGGVIRCGGVAQSCDGLGEVLLGDGLALLVEGDER